MTPYITYRALIKKKNRILGFVEETKDGIICGCIGKPSDRSVMSAQFASRIEAECAVMDVLQITHGGLKLVVVRDWKEEMV